jgi:restriction endonuclease S subunit
VAEIEGYQKVIDGARQVLDNYKPHIVVSPDWPVIELGDLCKPEYGYTTSALNTGSYRFIRITDIDADGKLKSTDAKYIEATPEAGRSLLAKGDVLVARTGATFGKTMLFNEDYPAIYASYLIRLSMPKDKVTPGYYWAFAQSTNYWQQANALMTGGGQPQFNGNALVKVCVPLPDLETQRAIVAEIEAEQALVNANRELIRRMEAKVKAAIDRVWGNEG